MIKQTIFLSFFLIFSLFANSVQAQVPYENVVEKIHYTHINRGIGSRNPFDAKKEIGSPNPQLRIYIWADLGEPYTKKFFDVTFPILLSKYSNDVVFIYNHRTLFMQDKSVKAGMIGECAAEQRQFWPNINTITNNLDHLDDLTYLRDIDLEQIKKCLADPYTKSIVDISERDGQYFGFNGSPILVIQNVNNPQGYSIKVSGAQDISIFDQAIQEAKVGDLNKKDLEDVKSQVTQLRQDVAEVKSQQTNLAQKLDQLIAWIRSLFLFKK